MKETRVRRAEALRILASEYKKKSVSDKDGLTTFVTQMGAQTGYTYTQHIHTYIHTYISINISDITFPDYMGMSLMLEFLRQITLTMKTKKVLNLYHHFHYYHENYLSTY